MNKRIFLLSGLAIIAVVLNHATSWGITSLFWWTDRYRAVTVPNFDQIGTFTYWVLFIVRKLTTFCVPAFLFVSGFFAGYASRGPAGLTWKVVRTRIVNLAVPYLIWSVVIFALDGLQGVVRPPAEYAVRLLATGAAGGYYYVPLLCQFYLLAPFLIRLARTSGRQLLLGCAVVQSITMAIRYLRFLAPGSTLPPALEQLVPNWLCLCWAFFFPLGIVCSFRLSDLKQRLGSWKRYLPFIVLALGAAAVLESELVFRTTRMDWASSPLTILSALLAVAAILWFLALDKIPLRLEKPFHYLGVRTYGIYLFHAKAMELVARVIRFAAPWALAYQLPLFLPIMVAAGLGVPLFFIVSIPKTRLRGSYRYLFG